MTLDQEFSAYGVMVDSALRALERAADEFLDINMGATAIGTVIPELVNQVCYQVMGYDAVVAMAAEASELELCMAEPIIAYDLLHGVMILKNACVTLASRCIVGIEANRDICRDYVERSIGLVTALVPIMGYEQSGGNCQGSTENGRQRLRTGPGKGLTLKRTARRHPSSRKHDGSA